VLWVHLDEYKKVLQQIVVAGHQIADHSWDHRDFKKLSLADVAKEVSSTSKKIEELSGIKNLVVRPPYGSISDGILKIIHHPVIMWSIDSYDRKRPNTDSIIANATTWVRAGSVILMHDTYERSINSVPSIIQILKWKGFTFVTIDELFWSGWLENGKKYNRVK
jgi:peptidoglycan-N-acetylglucosamine deacetylase